MLKEASDYTHVDVSDITVEGNILPARDMQGVGTGAWRVLKAEDAAYLAEMVCERDTGYRGTFSTYGPASVVLNWSSWLRFVARYLNSIFSIRHSQTGASYPNSGIVDPKYQFSQKNGVSERYLSDIYPNAFLLSPSVSYDETNKHVLKPDAIRAMFYDLSRLVRFWSNMYGTQSGSMHRTSDFLDYPTDGSSDSHTNEDVLDVKPFWDLSASGYDGSWFSVTKTTVTSASCTNLFGNSPPVYAEYVSEVIAFLRITTYINANGSNYLDGNSYLDIIPVSCAKSGNSWNLPSGFFSNNVAEAAIRRHGGDPDVLPTRMPEDTTGMTYTTMSMHVEWNVRDVVCLCKFPSDFSDLGWGWKP